jgi:hypothetical protein
MNRFTVQLHVPGRTLAGDLRLGSKEQNDPAIDALFANRGMIHASRNIPLPGAWSVLGGISLNAYGAPDGKWLAVQSPTRAQGKGQISLSWTLMRNLGGLNLPPIVVSRKGRVAPLAVQGAPLTFESIDFDDRFDVRTVDRRAAVMLIDQGILQWLLDCDRVSFQLQGDTISAVIQPGDAPRNPVADIELLFTFCEGFAARIPEIVRAEFSSVTPPT